MSKHSENSSFREKLIEHLLIGELMRFSWQNDCALEVARPEVDNAGYDVILESNRVIRHIQLKTSFAGAHTPHQKVHILLANKPSGCVVWTLFDAETLNLGPFLYLGGQPGECLSALAGMPVARHTKPNSDGQKAERANLRKVTKSTFAKLATIGQLYSRLFGTPILHARVSDAMDT